MTEDERAAYRAFVRDHHPDRGGDPEVFVAGMARFRAAGRPVPPDSSGAGGAGPDPDPDRRYDAPVEVVATLPPPLRAVVALVRIWRRRRNPRVDPPPDRSHASARTARRVR